MQKLTMTVREVLHEMRKAGIHCNERIISDGIASGAYPFGSVVATGATGRRTLNIFRTDFYSWLASKAPQESKLQLLRKSG